MAKSWLCIPSNSPFSLANIPFGVISSSKNQIPRPAIAIGSYALDLAAFSKADGFSPLSQIQPHISVFSQPNLNDFAALGRPIHSAVRKYLQSVFETDTPHAPILKDNKDLQTAALIPIASVKNYVPLKIGDYTDFYAGINHAFNVGVLFRGANNALQPNYKHLPVGYHGRASSVVVSGAELRRPRGQILESPGAKAPIFSPCRKLDYELELAAFVSKGNSLGEPIPIENAEDHIFGLVLMNDWSARDIQAWEYVPLGPFNSKNFGTTISPWVVLFDALEPFKTHGASGAAVGNDPEESSLLPYLCEPRKDTAYDIQLQIEIKPADSKTGTVVSKTNAKNLLYSFPQMLAHHTVTGCNANTGDLLGSGTISGPEPGTLGSLLEETKNGKEPLKLKGSDGSDKFFLQDGDEVIMTGVAGEEGSYVGFGDCRGVILPALRN
jgi:fumarylacetoacetase